MGFSIDCNQTNGRLLPSVPVAEILETPISEANLETIHTQNSIEHTNNICPISTPRLKASNAAGISVCGKPISPSAEANPNPCNKPNEAETVMG
jgi:hypothetical protein